MGKDLTFKEKVEYFMYPFMFELEAALKDRTDELKSINFHADEANTDRELKEYMKELIETSLTKLPNTQKQFKLNYINSKEYTLTFSYEDFGNIIISKVYLPDEINDEIKSIVKKENSVYTNPDLTLEITNGKEKTYVPVELKSTKTNSIPGSSIQQITPTEWVVFIKHTKNEIVVTTGQYIYAVNYAMQFPDRSPRPQVAFNELEKWNKEYRNFSEVSKEDEILTISISEDLFKSKIELLEDWQGTLVDRWLGVIKQSTIKRNEPWFNNTIRRYTRKFISEYEEMNETEKEELKNTLESAIDKYNNK